MQPTPAFERSPPTASLRQWPEMAHTASQATADPLPARNWAIQLGWLWTPRATCSSPIRSTAVSEEFRLTALSPRWQAVARHRFSGDGGPATSAPLGWPIGVAVDGAGNLFIADPGLAFSGLEFYSGYTPATDHRIRRVDSNGVITTIAGTGTPGFSGDGGPATSAALNGPIERRRRWRGQHICSGHRKQRRPHPAAREMFGLNWRGSGRRQPISRSAIAGQNCRDLWRRARSSTLVQNQPKNGQVSTELSGTTVSFNSFAAPILYTSAIQVAAVVPYAASGSTARVSVTYQGQVSADFTVPVATAAPNLFTLNQAGWGQAAAINAADGTVNTPANPVKIGGYISLYATGEGQTAPAGVDGKLGGSTATHPVLPVR